MIVNYFDLAGTLFSYITYKPMTKLPYTLEYSKVADSVLKHWTASSSQWLLRMQVNLFWSVRNPTGNRASYSCCSNKDVPQSDTVFFCLCLAGDTTVKPTEKNTSCFRRKDKKYEHLPQPRQSLIGGLVIRGGWILAAKSTRCSSVVAVWQNLREGGQGRTTCGVFPFRVTTKQDVAAGKTKNTAIYHPNYLLINN